jgi:tetratricopeptide (TPR) repeat protein
MKLTPVLCILAVAGLAGIPDARADRLSDARGLMDRGMFVTAATNLQAVVDEDADNDQAWALLAECQLENGDAEAAYNSATNALDLVDDESAGYWKLLGRAAFARGEAAYLAQAPGAEIKLWYADAEAKFKTALKQNPDDPDLLWRLGYANEWQEYPKKAREFYDEQIAKYPTVPEGYLRLGALLAGDATRIDNGQTPAAKKVRAQAIEVFTKGLEVCGDHGDILYNLGIAHEWNGDWAEAKDCYLRAVVADPELDKGWRRLFEKYRGDGSRSYQVSTATFIETAKSILKKHPTSPTAATWAGFFLIQDNRPAEALPILLKSLKEHREAGGVYQQAFQAAWGLRTSDAAAFVDGFTKIHEYYPFSGSAANNLGLYYRDTKGDYDRSLAWYLKAMEREPENQDIVNDTALIYLFHMKGATRKKSLPLLLKVVSMVKDDGQAPIRGYWDALENLCFYYWDVERDPEKVIEYADMRYEETSGVAPYSPSPKALHFKKLAEQELAK